ncbi:MAG: serine/threonine protein phosphatase [Lachnospiraceae bacterium]|nr:serine/threonine protein phosphatase [Lachnospiraceae bacterium]
MKKYYERYKHAIPLLVYALIYCSWFAYLEKTVKRPENLIHMKLDDAIPFCEVFIIPYFLWFVYVASVVLYFFFKDKQDYYRTCTFLFTGMTVFLIVSTLWPNGHHLRPNVMPRDNIFTALVARLYRVDTPTNLWPSIHVYNSLGAHFAIIKNPKLCKNKGIHIGSFILCVSIILSTVFLKQHSVFDVLTGFIMAAIMYIAVYGFDIVTVWQSRRIHARRRRIHQI